MLYFCQKLTVSEFDLNTISSNSIEGKVRKTSV